MFLLSAWCVFSLYTVRYLYRRGYFQFKRTIMPSSTEEKLFLIFIYLHGNDIWLLTLLAIDTRFNALCIPTPKELDINLLKRKCSRLSQS